MCASCERATAGECKGPCPEYDAIADVMDAAEATERQLKDTHERAARASGMAARLAEATQELARLDTPQKVIARTTQLALRCCFAMAAAVFQVDGASAEVLACSGAPFECEAAEIERAARAGLAGRGEPRARGRLVVLPLAEAGLVLAVERGGGDELADADLEPLAAFAAVASAALARARADVALREASARDVALLSAMREGALAVDRDGVVRAINTLGASTLGVRPEATVGKRLRDVAGLSALATALAIPGREGARVVMLPRGEVVVRAQPYDGGVVATIRDVPTEEAIARRTVGSVARYTFEHIVGTSRALLDVVTTARRAAEADAPILLCGESGTGKEMFAQAIHNASPRALEPFLAINVAAIPRELLEAELFGYEGGTFTGARSAGRPGKLELAGGGKLLLDEIGDMPAEMQAKLLRVLQERLVQRLGSARDIHVRARIIATTHRDLAEEVAHGRFRLDLYHRLRVIHLDLPPLRDRREDVPLLVEAHLHAYAERTGRQAAMAPHVLEAFQAYRWPGNVRELGNVLDGALGVLPQGETVLACVPPSLLQKNDFSRMRATISPSDVLPLEEVERRACEETLAAYAGNVKRAARALGVARQTLYNKMRRYGIEPDAFAAPAATANGAPRAR